MKDIVTYEDFEKIVDECTDKDYLLEFRKKNTVANMQNAYWTQRKIAFETKDLLERGKAYTKMMYLMQFFGASIPNKKEINRFTAPHGLYGIFISEGAKVGRDCIIYQHVTIGSNVNKDSKGAGFPTIGNNVLIGAGAKIIGNVTIGDHVRIGAGCCVTQDIPANSVVVSADNKVIQKDDIYNEHVGITAFKRYLERTSRKSMVNGAVFDRGIQHQFENAFSITFSGDLILLEDQVKRAYTGDGYDFSEYFRYCKNYFQNSDLTISVFEGPMGGETIGYTSRNFDDNKTLALNFPDEFAVAAKEAGYDLVTTANNHVLDKGVEAAKRTISVLDQIGLEHIGSYRNKEDKSNNRVKVIDKEGIRFCILAYTYGSNNYSVYDLLYNDELSYLTSIISTNEEYFERTKEAVRQDFELAKSYHPDFIIVLPHIGDQFHNEPSEMQERWFRTFEEFGADIILGCHPHVVQPIEIEENGNKKCFKAYCPGNYANIYRERQGDTSMLVSVYIDRDKKDIVGGSIVPLYTNSNLDGNYRAIPIFSIENNSKVSEQISTDDYERAEKAHKKITEVVFGEPFDMSQLTDQYYFNTNGFLKQKVIGLTLLDSMKKNIFWNSIQKVNSICFMGDSITEGTKNGKHPWYEPMEQYLKNIDIINVSKGELTIKELVAMQDDFPCADVYVIAIGTNDVRYRDIKICAMDEEEYVENCKLLRRLLIEKCQTVPRFIWIAPWYAADGDPYSRLNYQDKCNLNSKYSAALKGLCESEQDVYIDANVGIKKCLDRYPQRRYLVDHIHPNASKGVIIYSECVLGYEG